MIAELDRGKLSDQLKFFEGNGSKNHFQRLLQKMQNNIGNLSNASLEFLDYLSSDYGKELLQTNKLKIYVESGEIFHDNVNTGEDFYSFFSDQDDETKKFLNLNLDLSGDLEYYLREILSGTTNDRFELRKNATAKVLFHKFNKFQQSFGLSKFQLSHNQVSEDDYALKALENTNLAYFIQTLLEVLTEQVDIRSFSNQNR